jgi:hypothetical protein
VWKVIKKTNHIAFIIHSKTQQINIFCLNEFYFDKIKERKNNNLLHCQNSFKLYEKKKERKSKIIQRTETIKYSISCLTYTTSNKKNKNKNYRNVKFIETRSHRELLRDTRFIELLSSIHTTNNCQFQ